MKFKATTTKKGPDIQKMVQRGIAINGGYVTIGVHSDAGDYEDSGVSVAQVALWNEFGTPNALHPTPERSFLRSTVRENAGRIEKWRQEAVNNIMTKGWTPQRALEMIGLRVQLLVQNKIKSSPPPPNSPWTLKRKEQLHQGTDTLQATKKLLQSITFKVHLNPSGSGNMSPGSSPNNV